MHNSEKSLVDLIKEENMRLYELLRNNHEIDGDFIYEHGYITWKRNSKIFLQISYDTCRLQGSILCDFHWHCYPDPLDDLYKDLCEIGKKDNIMVVCSSFFGSYILYVGPKNAYYSNAKLTKKFGRKYVFE